MPRVEFPCIAAIAVEGAGFAHKINCGGPAYGDYAADPPAAPAAEANPSRPARISMRTGRAANSARRPGAAAAAIFEKMDGALPKPCTWVAGPGGIQPDGRPWDQVRQEYAFVDEFAALGPRVRARATGSVMITG